MFSSKNIQIVAYTFLIFSFIFGGAFALFNTYWSDGDEVHYLIATESIIEDHDLSLQNNYQNKGYFSHHGNTVDEHTVVSPIDGKHRSFHGFLLSLIVVPGFYFRNLLGARITIFVLHILFCLVLLVLLERLKFSKTVSYFTVGLFVLQLPIVLYAQYVYTDLLAGYLIVTAGLFGYQYLQSKYRLNLAAMSFVLGIAILLHVKLIFFGVLLIISMGIKIFVDNLENLKLQSFWQVIKSKYVSFLYLSLPWLGFYLLSSYIQYRWFGIFRPDAFQLVLLGNNYSDQTFTLNIFGGLFGMLFDGESGLITNAPLLILIIPGLVWLYKYSREYVIYILIPVALFLIFQSSVPFWNTWGPPARYMMDFVPVLLPALSTSLVVLWQKISGRLLVLLLSISSFMLSLTLFFRDRGGYPYYQDYNAGYRLLLTKLHLLRFEKYSYIDMVNPYWTDYARIVLIFVFIGLVYWYFDKKVVRSKKV
jgi:hypothetical protein